MYPSILCLALAVSTSAVMATPTTGAGLKDQSTEVMFEIFRQCNAADMLALRSADRKLNDLDYSYRQKCMLSSDPPSALWFTGQSLGDTSNAYYLIAQGLLKGSVDPKTSPDVPLEVIFKSLALLLNSEANIYFYQSYISGTLAKIGYSSLGEFVGTARQKTRYPNAEEIVVEFKDRLKQLSNRDAFLQRHLAEFTADELTIWAPLQAAVQRNDMDFLRIVLEYLNVPNTLFTVGRLMAEQLNPRDVVLIALSTNTELDYLNRYTIDSAFQFPHVPIHTSFPVQEFGQAFIRQLVNSLALGFVARDNADGLKSFLEMVEKNMPGFYTPRHLAAAVAVELDQEITAQGVLEGHTIPMAKFLVGCAKNNEWTKATEFLKRHSGVADFSQSPTYDCKTYLPNDTTLHLSPDHKMALTYTLPNVSK
ncbi:hypothetical protein H4R33_006498 [Dimargaris cristalligena]|nr:hypothetical protein H4R33_006498 [Dimargaris cristalligena]